MKKARSVFFLFVFLVVFAGETFACDYCRLPLSLKQGCDTVAYKVGGQSADCRKKFLREMVTGFHQGRAAVLPPGAKFTWTVDNDGFVRQTYYLSRPQNGRIYPTNVCGKEIAFSYPADNSFLFGVTLGKPSGNFSTAVGSVTPIAYRPSVVAPSMPAAPAEEKKYHWDGTEVEVPPMEQRPEKKSAPKATQKKGGKG